MVKGRQRIAVGVIHSKDKQKVLVSKRSDRVMQGGLWEFPGGKCHENENISETLKRELFEELNLFVDHASPLISIDHDYPEISVRLEVWSVSDWHGSVFGKEGQSFEWVTLDQLNQKQFPKANDAIIAALKLPSLYLITPDLDNYDEYFLQRLEGFLQAGVSLLQFRSKRIGQEKLNGIFKDLINLCDLYSCKLLFNGTPDASIKINSHGVHLSSNLLRQLTKRPLPEDKWVAASCHNKAELEKARAIGCDFVVLSPVNVTSSHPGTIPMGWKNFAELVKGASFPVYALGGMKADDLVRVKKLGGQGLSMISGIWNSKDPFSEIAMLTRISHKLAK